MLAHLGSLRLICLKTFYRLEESRFALFCGIMFSGMKSLQDFIDAGAS